MAKVDSARALSRIDRAGSRTPCEHIVRACLVASFALLGACQSSVDVSNGTTESETVSQPPSPETPPPAPIPDPTKETTPTPETPSTPATLTPAALLAKLKECATKVSSAPFAKDSGGPASIDVCGLGNAVYWKADLDVD